LRKGRSFQTSALSDGGGPGGRYWLETFPPDFNDLRRKKTVNMKTVPAATWTGVGSKAGIVSVMMVRGGWRRASERKGRECCNIYIIIRGQKMDRQLALFRAKCRDIIQCSFQLSYVNVHGPSPSVPMTLESVAPQYAGSKSYVEVQKYSRCQSPCHKHAQNNGIMAR